jgi:hypothetical protein
VTPALGPAERLSEARARFAESLDVTAVQPTLGSITLRPNQIDAVRRVRAMLRRDGGCLLADDVGTGKTYVALAIAQSWARPLVVVPASLRSTWKGAMRRAAVRVEMATHESLSRGAIPIGSFDGIVVDESHRFRPASRRHAALGRLGWRAPLLLLSATPLQNRARELAGQLALFLGEMTYALEPAALTRWIVRASVHVDDMLPAVAPPRWLEPDVDDGDVLEALLALPPPPRAADAGDGGALLLLSLVRAWASSRAALLASLRRRRRSLVALEQCHAEGRVPTRRELAAWSGDDAVQLGFSTLLALGTTDEAVAAHRAQALHTERRALDIIYRAAERDGEPDAARVRVLRDVCARHRGVAVLAFSEWASTVRAYFAAMRADAGVGMLTAREGRIASGRLARDALLARFAPQAQGAPDPHARERVTLLLTTDLLSEGVNLQDAAVVVHLDLPWNPARLAQRLGRIRRPGGASEVASYLMAPPARSALLLRAEARLRGKLSQAERTVGRGLEVLPALSADGWRDQLTPPAQDNSGAAFGVAELHGEVHRLLGQWRPPPSSNVTSACHASVTRCPVGEPVIAAARSDTPGWLAVLDDGRLIASSTGHGPTALVGGATDDVARVASALRSTHSLGPSPADVDPIEASRARRAVEAWIAADWMRVSCAIDLSVSPIRRRALQRLDAMLRRVPRHRRPHALSLAQTLRDALVRPMSLGAERALDALGGTSPHESGDPSTGMARVAADSDESWLTRSVSLINALREGANAAPMRPPEPTAIILLVAARA